MMVRGYCDVWTTAINDKATLLKSPFAVTVTLLDAMFRRESTDFAKSSS